MDLDFQELAQIDGATLTAQSPARDTFALRRLALVVRNILVMRSFEVPGAVIEVAVERLPLVDPD
jgi:hypothetical protein